MYIRSRIVFNQAGDGGAGGAAGSGGGTNPPGGGGPSLNGGAATPPVGAGAGQPPPGNAPAGGGPTVVIPENWKQALPPELQSDPNLAVIKDLPGLAKSYVNAQKMIGVDKIPVPSKHATEDEWRQVHYKLGLPEKFDDYKGAVKVAKEAGLNEQFVGQFIEQAHKHGVLPKQAQAVLDWFTQASKAGTDDIVKAHQNALTQELEGVKKHWGQKYDEGVSAAQTLMKKFASPEDMQYLMKNGYDKDPRLIKIFGDVGLNLLKEGDLPGGPGTGGSKMTPAQAKEELNKIYAQMASHPAFDKGHPNHSAAVAEMDRLSAMARG